ncbi:MAG: NAD(P)/FAD-dependent oxidoreductase [Vicinamibacterales bacterium]
MRTFDAVVVGGGPAGSTCARRLVASGASVAVIDSARFPRDKCCAGWITPQVVDVIGLDLNAYASRFTLQPIRGFVTSTIGERPVTTRFPRIVSYAIRRYEFDHYLLECAGATLVLGTPVRRIERVRDRWRIDDRVEAPMLIGAGGQFCPVARLLQPGRITRPLVLAQELEVALDETDSCGWGVTDPELPELFFSPDRLGYGWCVRKDAYINVGYGHFACADFQARVSEFKAHLESNRRHIAVTRRAWPGHAYHVYAGSLSGVVADGALLVGDAAGLADATSGEGILRAVESGAMAADTIVAGGGRRDAQALLPYAEAFRARYGKPPRIPAARNRPATGALAAIGRHLLRSPWFTRKVLLERWFLHQSLAGLKAES